MATKKITDLTATTDLADADVFVVNDASASADRKVAFSTIVSEIRNGGSFGTSTAITEMQVDNININGNTISTTNTNGDLILSPNGSGRVNAGVVGDDSADMTSGGDGQLKVNGGGYTFAVANNDTGTFLYNNGSNRDLIFGLNETERVRILSNGNVGIGTSSPSEKLGVNGGADFQSVNVNAQASGNVLSVNHNSAGNPNTFNVANFGNTGTDAGAILRLYDQTGVNRVVLDPRQSGLRESFIDGRFRVTGATTLTGGIYLGGTASANLLDDIEWQTTYTATLTPDQSGSITLGSNNTLSVDRIGNRAFVEGLIDVSSVSSPIGDFIDLNLPYATNVGSTERLQTPFTLSPTSATIIGDIVWGLITSNTVRIYVDASTIVSGNRFNITFNYPIV